MESDEAREDRIAMEIVVDAYGSEEQAMGWYYYLEKKMQFPFKATCIQTRSISPLKKDVTVVVVGMAPSEECEKEMFVEISWEEDVLAVPLSQLKALETDQKTQEAMEDWHYWVDQGYAFG